MRVKKGLFQRRFAPVHRNDDGGGGGSGGKTFTEAQVQSMLEEATTGLKSKNTELLGKVKDFDTKLKAWDGLEPEKVRKLLGTFEQNEELKLISEGKHDQVIQRRIEREQAKFQSQLEELTGQLSESKQQLSKANNQVRDLMIDTTVLAAFRAEGGLPTASDDVVLRATVFFDVEDGEVVARDGKGELVRGKNGPITIKEWVTDLKTSAPHLFPQSKGAGAGGGPGSGTDLETKMSAAASAGNMKEYRRLKAERAKQRAGS